MTNDKKYLKNIIREVLKESNVFSTGGQKRGKGLRGGGERSPEDKLYLSKDSLHKYVKTMTSDIKKAKSAEELITVAEKISDFSLRIANGLKN